MGLVIDLPPWERFFFFLDSTCDTVLRRSSVREGAGEGLAGTRDAVGPLPPSSTLSSSSLFRILLPRVGGHGC